MPLTEIAVKEYTALISQSGTAAPTVIILKNTIGNIVWTRSSTGIYYGTLANAFTDDKTTFNITPKLTPWNLIISRDNSNVISITTYNSTTPADDLLTNTPIKIQVYND